MIHKHKNLHSSALNSSAPTLYIDRDQATMQLEALGYSWGNGVYVSSLLNLCTDADTRCVSQPTSTIGATTDLLKSNTPSHPDYSSAPTDIPKQGVFDLSQVIAGEVL